MKPYQLRVKDEHKELTIKIGKLFDFMAGDVFYTLSAIEQLLLNEQVNAMLEYQRVLHMRISVFEVMQ